MPTTQPATVDEYIATFPEDVRAVLEKIRRHEVTEVELAPYRSGRGTVKLPLGQPVPYPLVARLVELLVEQRHEGG